ncbi:MAG: FtsQ-type POTRA domain-containing protein [Chloroflexi bacterium]|nr:FtsQ-type POTRA domain-containing protein [Chloroflexota bacterium]
MPTFYRSSPKRSRARPKRKKKRRFLHPSVAVLDPRRLLPDPPPARQNQGKTRAKHKARSHSLAAFWNLSHYCALLILLAALFGLGYTLIDSAFYVYFPDVETNRYTRAEDVINFLRIYDSSIYTIDPQEIATRLEQLPHVQTATVQTALPARLHIQLQEWEPVLIYKLHNQQYWVSPEGRVAPEAEPRALVVLTDEEQAVAIDDQHLNPDVVNAVLRIHQALPEVKSFRYQEPLGLWFASPEGWVVYLGSPDRISQKIALWETVRKRILEENLQVTLIDLRYRLPTWR